MEKQHRKVREENPAPSGTGGRHIDPTDVEQRQPAWSGDRADLDDGAKGRGDNGGTQGVAEETAQGYGKQ